MARGLSNSEEKWHLRYVCTTCGNSTNYKHTRPVLCSKCGEYLRDNHKVIRMKLISKWFKSYFITHTGDLKE